MECRKPTRHWTFKRLSASRKFRTRNLLVLENSCSRIADEAHVTVASIIEKRANCQKQALNALGTFAWSMYSVNENERQGCGTKGKV